MNFKTTSLLLALCCVTHITAAEMTGYDFLDFCETPQARGVVCPALVTGLIAGFNAGYGNGMQGAISGMKGEAWERENQEFLNTLFGAGRICLQKGVTPNESATIVIEFFQDHPEFRDRPVADGLKVIFSDHRCD